MTRLTKLHFYQPNFLRLKATLPELEGVDLGMQLPGVDQRLHDVVAQTLEPQGDSAQVLQPDVDRFDRCVECADIEVRQHVLLAPVQRVSQLLDPPLTLWAWSMSATC